MTTTYVPTGVPAAHTVNNTTIAPLVLERLREEIRHLERGSAAAIRDLAPLTFGDGEVDGRLPGGGLSRHGLHEVLAPPAPGEAWYQARLQTAGAVTGFVAGLLTRAQETASGPVLWCRPGRDLYAPGLEAYGLDTERLLLAHPKNDTETLWAMEEGLLSGAVAAVVGELQAPSHTAFRRLQLAAERGGVPGFLLRAGDPARAAGPVSTRWAVRSAPSLPDEAGAGWPGRPRFDVELVRARGGAPGQWRMEWRYDRDFSAPCGFRVVSDARDAASVARPEPDISDRISGGYIRRVA